MKKWVIRYYKCDGGENPGHHQAKYVTIRTEYENGQPIKSTIWSSSMGRSADTLAECLDELFRKYTSVIQTGYKEEFYWEKNIVIK